MLSEQQPPALWLLTLLTFSGTLGMHIFIPALPQVAHDLAAEPAVVQNTITLYVAGLALGQLFYGPVSDGIGRRPALMAGLALYSVAGMLCAIAPTAGVLLGARLLQALGGCAGLLLGRAIVRDTCDAEQTVRRLAMLTTMMLAGPALAPVVGGVWVTLFGWRALFVALSALGMINIILVWRLLPETGAASGRVGLAGVGRDYASLLRAPAFLGYSIGGGCATTAQFAFLACAPFIYVHQFGRSQHEVGLVVGLLMLGIAVGNLVARGLVGRLPTQSLIVGANAVSAVTGVGIFLHVLFTGSNALVMTCVMFVYMVGVGACGPAASMKAISVDLRRIGSAAGLFGFVQMGIGSLSTYIAAQSGDAALAASAVLAATGLMAQLALRLGLTYDSR